MNQIIHTWLTHNQHQCNSKLLKRIYHDLHQIIMHWGRRRTGSYHRAYHLYWQQLNGKIKQGKKPNYGHSLTEN
ncbi:hypothetical protein NG796_06140 [Laspinema sp. A4]|nr:hypothetical protein [Laspinema sp. D2d]